MIRIKSVIDGKGNRIKITIINKFIIDIHKSDGMNRAVLIKTKLEFVVVTQSS